MLTAEQIARAKTQLRLHSEAWHEHDDCIRMAYEWLDAQKKIRAPRRYGARPLKHIIEKWGNRYVSQADVEIAAHMHPDIIGTYPYFNLSARLTEPSYSRLDGIGEANKHDYARQRETGTYARKEA